MNNLSEEGYLTCALVVAVGDQTLYICTYVLLRPRSRSRLPQKLLYQVSFQDEDMISDLLRVTAMAESEFSYQESRGDEKNLTCTQ